MATGIEFNFATGEVVDTSCTIEVVDLTPEQLAEQAKAEARQYLASTDWYVTRFAETGVAVPEDVTAKRAEARAML